MVFELDDERWGFLVGDAAFQTHFWPGRGLNSAFKEALFRPLSVAYILVR